MFGTRALYVSIVSALGAVPRFHKAEVMAQAATLLAAEEAERHRRVLVAIDEAHLLSPAQLEELRLMANDAAARLHRYANGLPRALNNAATAALMAAAAEGKALVDDACARRAVTELTRE